MSEYSQIMDARDYLINNVLLPLHPNIEPLPTLIGVCTQVDNVSTEILRLRAELAAARRDGWIAGRDAAAEHVCGYCVRQNSVCADHIRNMEPPT